MVRCQRRQASVGLVGLLSCLSLVGCILSFSYPCRQVGSRASAARRNISRQRQGEADSFRGTGNRAVDEKYNPVEDLKSWGASYLPNPPEFLKSAAIVIMPLAARWTGWQWHVAFVVVFPLYMALLREAPGPKFLGGHAWAPVPASLSDSAAAQLKSPLGSVGKGKGYRAYVSTGAVFGALLPFAVLVMTLLTMAFAALRGTNPGFYFGVASKLAMAHTFLLLAQILTEDFHRTRDFPPTLRILVPIIYNSIRLPVLWSWVSASWLATGSWPMFVVASGNCIFWHFNLLFFLVPIAMRQYSRSYFHICERSDSHGFYPVESGTPEV